MRMWLVVIASLVGCSEDPPCVRANELLAPCVGEGTTTLLIPGTGTSYGYGYYEYDSGYDSFTCAQGTVEACRARCTIIAIEAKGCEGVTDQFQNSDYLKCSLDCIDAGNKKPLGYGR